MLSPAGRLEEGWESASRTPSLFRCQRLFVYLRGEHSFTAPNEEESKSSPRHGGATDRKGLERVGWDLSLKTSKKLKTKNESASASCDDDFIVHRSGKLSLA